jgi:hypothetical protein
MLCPKLVSRPNAFGRTQMPLDSVVSSKCVWVRGDDTQTHSGQSANAFGRTQTYLGFSQSLNAFECVQTRLCAKRSWGITCILGQE